MENISLSIFFPCYNDAGTIGSLVLSANEVAKSLTNDFEIIVVDDCSKDRSKEILQSLIGVCDTLRVIYHEKNRGYGGALRTGFNNAIKEFVFYTDGDGQYDVKELVVLCKKMNENIDYVNGYKLKRNDPWYRIVIGKIYHHTMKLIFGFKIRDVDCDFRLIKRSIFDRVDLKNNSGVICVEMITKFHQSNLKFREVGVTHYHRLHGKSQFFNFSRIIRVIIDLFYLWCELKLDKPTIRKQK